jgi:hypothetical protein
VLRSDPQRSHALFPHATTAKSTTKVYHEDIFVVLRGDQSCLPWRCRARRSRLRGRCRARLRSRRRGRDTFSHTRLTTAPASASTSLPAPNPSICSRAAQTTRVGQRFEVGESRNEVKQLGRRRRLCRGDGRLDDCPHPPHHCSRVRIHVFARAQSQYLFPGSADNTAKKFAVLSALPGNRYWDWARAKTWMRTREQW